MPIGVYIDNDTRTMKSSTKKKATRNLMFKRRPTGGDLGRSPVTGARALKSVAKGASISLDDVRRVVRDLEPLALD
jgi:hypothetical protein